MPTKAQVYAQLADETALKVTGSYLDWAAFLTTMSIFLFCSLVDCSITW